MEKEFNIHTSYGNLQKILICKPSTFLSLVAKHFKLKEEEIEIYEINKNSKKKKITVENLRDIIKVEIIKRKPSLLENQHNGHRQNETPPSFEEMCLKLKEKRTMTAQEEELLFSHLPNSLKRRIENGNRQQPEMKNRKVQANRIDLNSAYTQTDKLIGSSRSICMDIKDLLQEIKNYARKEKKNPEKVEELMSDSFNHRRNSIIKDHLTVALLKEQYSILFTLSQVRNELDRILSDGTSEKFIRNIEMYARHILSMEKDTDPLLLTIRQKEKELSTPAKKKYAVEVGSILMLTSMIGENRYFLKLDDTSIPDTTFPYIEARTKLHGIFSNNHIFKVYAENILICEATDFKEAILCLMACYFIFNIKYPPDNFSTLVIMEKLYLEGIDTEIDDICPATQQLIKCLQLKAAV